MTRMPDETIDDKQVVSAVLAGDAQRFALLVQRYSRPLMHLATNRLGREDLAEEAVQDAFVCAYRSLHTYKPEFGFRTWLWTILLNQCRRHGGRQAKLPAQSSAMQIEERVSTQTPDDAAMLRERNAVLRELLVRLPEPQADAIRLRFFGQLKFQEIADVMQSSLSAAKQRVRFGLEGLSALMKENNLVDYVLPGDQREDHY